MQRTGTAVLAAQALAQMPARAAGEAAFGERPRQDPAVRVLNPRGRVPLSFIIDDSTCLVNMAHFGIPQFAEVSPDRYTQPWRTLPREIPDAFVREFAEWCDAHDVKGKYSIVPYPACVGWVDRGLPGWSKQELDASLELVRTLLPARWDFHPEMVSHTRVIDIKTGRPYPHATPEYMENWGWTDGKSVDEIAAYMAYALQILKNVGLPCEGITTPGGFGNGVRPELAQATLQSCRSVFQAEIPHYFRHLYTGDESVAPRVEYASGLESADPRCVVSIIGCTGDWFGGWDGLVPGSADQFITRDLRRGRLPEVIARGEPTILVCHWPGIYYNGEKIGFNIFKTVVQRLEAAYDNLLWMKLSEIARYWAAKELTRIERAGRHVALRAPFATQDFTLEVALGSTRPPEILRTGAPNAPLVPARNSLGLRAGQYFDGGGKRTLCFDLPKGDTRISGLA
jgi:hypothetical protein